MVYVTFLILFEYLVGSFYLSVRLGVKGGGQSSGYVQPLADMRPKVTHELGSTVRDNGGGETMMGNHVSEESVGYGVRLDVVQRDQDDAFAQSVRYYQEVGASITAGKFDNEVHGEFVPYSVGDRKRF